MTRLVARLQCLVKTCLNRPKISYADWCAKIAKLADKKRVPQAATSIQSGALKRMHEADLTPRQALRLMEKFAGVFSFGRDVMDHRKLGKE